MVSTVSPEPTVAVIGVGNILMGDEGLGVRALKPLGERVAEFGDRVELVDAGTALIDILDDYTGCDVILLIDVVRGGGVPGAIYRFEPEDLCRTRGGGVATSLHQMSVLEVLEMERLTGREIPKVIILGMEPENIRLGLELSETVAGRLPRLVETVLDEIRRILSANDQAERQT